MILHADANSFYASCEQLFRPDIRNKPVIVLSNNDGCAVALTKEAKALGLKRGDPYFQIKDVCDAKGVTVFSSNYTFYADISRRIASIYSEYAPAIEEYSIDESFLFFDKCNWTYEDYYEIASELKYRIKKEVGLPICVGVAPTKTLAKLYNKKAKLHNGVYVYEEDKVDDLLANTPCGEIWGIGPSRERKLHLRGINTALDLKHMPYTDAHKLLTSVGLSTVYELNGYNGLQRIERNKSKNITTSRQFNKKTYDLASLECALATYTEGAVEKLRAQHSETNYVTVYLSTCNHAFEDDLSQVYSNSITVQLSRPTSYTPDIYQAALTALHHLYRPCYPYRTVMITLNNLTDESYQGLLWDDPDNELRNRKLMNSVDQITHDFGRNGICMAKSMSVDGWQNKREKLSPCWTTRWDDLPLVH